ncbi:MAG: hypothetical protein COA88_04300 [Kordia sp.]|nr:MAG: hypothetical protein COA88_04300 [Kordia sp.]
MKNKILFFCISLTILSLTAFSFMKQKNQETDQLKIVANENSAIKTQAPEKVEKSTFTDFIYDVGPRFRAIKKRDVDNAISIATFFDEKQLQSIVSLKSVNIIIIKGEKRIDTRTTGHSNKLTAAQLKLIQSFDYSTNFLIRVEYQQINKETGELEDSYSTPHLTIIPEKQAVHIDGKNELKKFLKENSKKSRTTPATRPRKPWTS